LRQKREIFFFVGKHAPTIHQPDVVVGLLSNVIGFEIPIGVE